MSTESCVSRLTSTLTKIASATPLTSTLTKTKDLKSFNINTYRKGGRGERFLRGGRPGHWLAVRRRIHLRPLPSAISAMLVRVNQDE